MEAGDLLRDLKRKVDELAAFHEIGKALTGTLEQQSVLELIMLKVGELLSPSHWSLLLLEEPSGELVFALAAGPNASGLKGQRLEPGEGIAGHAVRAGEPVLVPDVRGDERFSARFDKATGHVTRSVLAVPLRVRGLTLGVLELVNGPDAHIFTPEDLRTLASLGDYAAIAIDNSRNFARVQELTLTDEHTGLYNARHLRRVLAAEVARAERFRHPVSLVFFDLDHFKTVNDTYGHMVGSEALREVGERLRKQLRTTDVPTRYGGDEFAIVLPETDPSAAVEVARRWQALLRSAPFGVSKGLALSITASFGVATYPDHAQTPDALLAAADAAMYRAKNKSRDAVESAGDSQG
jgi:diguanylate cyclase (GGDEF)-like protein